MEQSYKFPIFLVSVMEMIFLALFTNLLSGYIEKNILFIIIGIAFMIAAIPLHILGKHFKPTYIFSILFNTLGSAWFCAMYYTAAECKTSLSELFMSLIPAGIVLLLSLILLFVFPKLVIAMLAVNLVISIVSIVQWIHYPAECVYSFTFFASVITFMCICSMIALAYSEEGSALRYASFAAFGIFFVIAFVVLLILSEGEILDGAIPDFDLSAKKKKVK